MYLPRFHVILFFFPLIKEGAELFQNSAPAHNNLAFGLRFKSVPSNCTWETRFSGPTRQSHRSPMSYNECRRRCSLGYTESPAGDVLA